MMHERFRSPSPAGMGALRGVLDTVPVGIAIFGPDGSPRLVNRAARDILGDLASAPLARWVDQRRITRPDGTPMELEDLPPWAALQDGRPRREVDICIRRPAGIRFPVLVSADAVRDAEDNILQVACSITAIEAWRQRADAARRAVKMEAIGTLAASLAG
ncbi:MAG: PAS domain-containing protein, partial [Planctomycetota bacterium]